MQINRLSRSQGFTLVELLVVIAIIAVLATIAATKTSAMSNVRGLGSEVAIAIVEKLTGQAPSATEASEAVDQVLARG